MNRIYDGNFWECDIPGVTSGQMYKYRIYKNDGSFIDHADPYAFYSELRPGTASVTWTSKDYRFHDKEWQKNGKDRKNKPVNIYEMHFGSWKARKKAQEKDGTPIGRWQVLLFLI